VKLLTAEAGDLTLAYRQLGSGPAVLLVHGWPTSSFLWRDVMPPIARENRVIALDLPGFGGSDKPAGADYGFGFFEEAIDAFLDVLGIEELSLAAHDLGGPVAVHWALGRPGRVKRLALLNTLVYPEFSEAVMQFLTAASTPGVREQLTSPQGLEAAMRLGLADGDSLRPGVVAAVVEPFQSEEARTALAAAGIGLEPSEFERIARELPSLKVPVRVIYGEQDRILPDIAETAARLERELAEIEVTALPDCGHFLQEESGAEIGELLAGFFSAAPSEAPRPA
jgi:pimeloyl-ACP methyl ester carboxylesterase